MQQQSTVAMCSVISAIKKRWLKRKKQPRLQVAQLPEVGDDWLASWAKGLPDRDATSGELNLPVLLGLN